ncbi:hydroxymethylbilane synthase [uncultured Jatrophihabitans sp.]|uniref:hydroxymethylbilane synthase n=1 Tax=uncultured Jatrophihabitans sp. TaxID=1610747 RepID=UPI0035C961F5
MTATRTLRIGTRASRLARTQTDSVANALPTPAEIVHIQTEGDRSAAALTQIGGTGVFVSALRTALLERRIDVAVHSYKDLPTGPQPGISIGAVPQRADARDALVARDGLTLGELPTGARVGTGSPRRAAQLNALGLGLDVVAVRGNIDTRMGRVFDGELDAVVLAYAGLQRIERTDAVTEILDPIQVLPAAAQGALAVECRADDDAALEVVAALDHPDSRTAVAAERALLEALEAGCSAPVGALAEIVDGDSSDSDPLIFLRGSVTALDGSDAVRLSATGSTTDAAGVGRRLAAELLADGADNMMGSTT